MENKFIEDIFEAFARYLFEIVPDNNAEVELSVKEEDYKSWVDMFSSYDYCVTVKEEDRIPECDSYMVMFGVGYKVKFKDK